MALSADGKARAGMGVDAGDVDNSGVASLAITNFEGEMIGMYADRARGTYRDVATEAGVGFPSRNYLGFGCVLGDFDLDGRLDLLTVNGHIDDTVRNIRGNVGVLPAAAAVSESGEASASVMRREPSGTGSRSRASPAVWRSVTSTATVTWTS